MKSPISFASLAAALIVTLGATAAFAGTVTVNISTAQNFKDRNGDGIPNGIWLMVADVNNNGITPADMTDPSYVPDPDDRFLGVLETGEAGGSIFGPVPAGNVNGAIIFGGGGANEVLVNNVDIVGAPYYMLWYDKPFSDFDLNAGPGVGVDGGIFRLPEWNVPAAASTISIEFPDGPDAKAGDPNPNGFTTVPEPASAALLGLSGLALLARRRR